MKSPIRLARALSPAWAGAGAGLVVFLAESVLVLRGEAVGLKIDLRGPLAVVFPVVRSLLPGLLGRIALGYALAGAAAGLLAGALVWLLAIEGRWRARGLFAVEFLALATLLCWRKAVLRPTLFDDLPSVRPALAWLVDHGEPWHPVAIAGVWVAIHVLVGALRRGLASRLLEVRLRRAVVAGLAAVGLGVAGLALAATSRHARHPLVVVIGLDAFRPDRLPLAPNLQRFVKDAAVFDRAYTPIAQTEPAWRSLLTARWPTRTGVRYPLTPDSRVVALPTFAAEFASAGYHTAFFTDCSRFHWEGPASGFSERVEPPRGALNFLLEKLRYRGLGVVADNALGAALVPELIDNRAMAGVYDPKGYAQRMARSWVRRAEAGPALLAYHAVAAHFPGDPTYPYYRALVAPAEPLDRRLRMVFSPIQRGEKGPSTGAGHWTREGAEALYGELLEQADAQLGILLDALRERGLYDEATIVVFSDHGESFHPDFAELAGATSVHGARLSEDENHIILAVKLPHASGQKRVDALVRLVDVGPTLLDAAGLPPLEGADGVSLMPLIRGEPAPERWLYAETAFTHASPDAFDSDHWVGAPRTFEAYRVRPDGVVEMTDEAGVAAVHEKDVGAFDGRVWLVRAPRVAGGVAERCTGDCSALAKWLDGGAPPR